MATGLVVPAAQLNRKIPELVSRFGEPAFYELGWGDKGFYQAQEITSGLTLRAMLLSSGAVVHVVAIPHSPAVEFPNSQVVSICFSETQLEHLAAFISSSLVHDPFGKIVPLSKGIYGDSQFYDGKGRYSILHTCNKWVAKGLSNAGVDISTVFKLTAGSIMRYVENSPAVKGCAVGSYPPVPSLGAAGFSE